MYPAVDTAAAAAVWLRTPQWTLIPVDGVTWAHGCLPPRLQRRSAPVGSAQTKAPLWSLRTTRKVTAAVKVGPGAPCLLRAMENFWMYQMDKQNEPPHSKEPPHLEQHWQDEVWTVIVLICPSIWRYLWKSQVLFCIPLVYLTNFSYCPLSIVL